MELRPYQREAIESLVAGWGAGARRLAVVLPTGSGKTIVFAHLIQRMRAEAGIARALVLAHREELLDQAADKIRAVAPHLKVGIVKGNRRELRHDTQVIVASVQTLGWRRPCRNKVKSQDGRKLKRCGTCTRCKTLPNCAPIHGVGMIVVDECHHAGAASYKRVLRHFRAFDEDSKVLTAGFTATLARQQGGLASVWQDVAYRRDINDMIADGYLVPPHGKQVVVPGMDLDKAKKSGGDFTGSSLAELMLHADAMSEIAQAYQEYASDRPGIVFCPDVEVAHEMTDAFNGIGIPAATVWGTMPGEERREVLKDFRERRVQVLSNCMVLTEGFDAPLASCLVVARPTMSPGLYIQMAGRVLRPSPETGKTDALILDVTGATSRHRLASIVDLGVQRSKEASLQYTNTDAEEPEEEEVPDEPLGPALPPDKELLQIAGWRDVQIYHDPSQTYRAHWVRTPKGHWFVAAGESSYFAVRGLREGTWHKRGVIGGEPMAPPPANDLPMSMEQAVLELDRIGVAKAGNWDDPEAPWRKKAPSEKMLAAAFKMGIRVEAGMRAGEVSDLITSRIQGRKVDWVIAQHERMLKKKQED